MTCHRIKNSADDPIRSLLVFSSEFSTLYKNRVFNTILSQRSSLDDKVHLCDFYSHRLSSAERNYDVGNREHLAIHLALGEWRHWLEGASMLFIVWTDHQNLYYIRSTKRLNARQALFFGRFEFSISFRPGSKNLKPDALSRQFCSSGGPSATKNTLPQRCVVGAATWGVEQAVRRALFHVTRPARAPKGTLHDGTPGSQGYVGRY